MLSRLVYGSEYCLESYTKVGRDLIKSGFLSKIERLVLGGPRGPRLGLTDYSRKKSTIWALSGQVLRTTLLL